MILHKAGIIGLGVGEQHIAACLDAGLEVVICDLNPDKLAEVQDRYPLLQAVTEPERVLSDPDIGLISVASWDDAHHSQILAALAHEKHVFVEKPLCLYAAEAREIRNALKAKPHLRLSSNLILRCSPRFQALQQRIQSGEMGRLYYIEGDYNYGRIHKIVTGWRGQLPFYSVVLGGGIHLLDLMVWLSNDRIVSVTALGNQIASAGTSFRFPDLVVALLQFESGMVGKMAVNFGCVYPHFHPLQVYGTQATFVNRLEDAELFTSRENGVAPRALSDAYPGVHKGHLLKNFIEAISHSLPLPVSEDEIFAILSVCFAIEQALQTGGKVIVDYI